MLACSRPTAARRKIMVNFGPLTAEEDEHTHLPRCAHSGRLLDGGKDGEGSESEANGVHN